MRIRSTKPEFWRSNRVSTVDWEDRLVLKGLESYVDDNGVGKDDIELIVGDLFQRDLVRDPSRTLARVSGALDRLNVAGLLWRYVVDGTSLLYVAFWESIQRIDKPQRGRFPRPDGTMNYKDSEIRECVANPRDASRTFAPGTGEQGNRGAEEQGDTSSASPPPSQEPIEGFIDEPSTDVAVVDNVIEFRRNDAGAILGELIDRCTARRVKLPERVKGHFAREIGKAINDEKTEPDIVRAALASMVADNVLDKPSLLPNRIVKAQTGDEVYRRGKSTSVTDERAAGWIMLGAQMGATS